MTTNWSNSVQACQFRPVTSPQCVATSSRFGAERLRVPYRVGACIQRCSCHLGSCGLGAFCFPTHALSTLQPPDLRKGESHAQRSAALPRLGAGAREEHLVGQGDARLRAVQAVAPTAGRVSSSSGGRLWALPAKAPSESSQLGGGRVVGQSPWPSLTHASSRQVGTWSSPSQIRSNICRARLQSWSSRTRRLGRAQPIVGRSPTRI